MDKIDKLLDAAEHPERYTPEDIEAMLRDPEVKETLDLLDKTKSSLQTIVTPDVEEEWKRFRSNHSESRTPNRRWLMRVFSRNAAASIAIGIVSFTAAAAIVGFGIQHLNNRVATTPEKEIIADAEAPALLPDTIKSAVSKTPVTPEIVVFENETLESIISQIAAYYGDKVAFNNEASKSLRLYFRWDKALPIEEVAERLNNFEQIHISIDDKTIKID